MKKIPVWLFLLITVITTQGVSYLFKLFEYDPYFFLLGFRFHIAFIIPAVFLFWRSGFIQIKNTLLTFRYKKIIPVLLIMLIPPLLVTGGLFGLEKVKINDSDYFYELGLSSILDFPIYFIWNLPQILFLYSFLLFLKERNSFFLLSTFFLLSLFLFEFIPLGKDKFEIFNALNYAVVVFFVTVLFYRIKNFYSFALILFFTLWCSLLLYGSSSEQLIKMLLARNYSEWEGFLKVDKLFLLYIFMTEVFVTTILLFFVKTGKKLLGSHSKI
ncbi:MAG TPA: hypothetical protein PK397_05390 [Ignavibacteriaceae bacterium]|nr:hypothetical protein [Ignavibacteriaceae bacterium]